ncbi:MAG TPA: hypothetical protein VG367_15230 [Mucilaginibacter sp.]|jgi:hypothetical protein|nr:hypothetical protein [Mucilaginibacter sp.]
MKPYHFIIPALLLCYSCHQDEVKLVDGPKFGVNKGKKEGTDFNAQNGAGGFDATQGTALGAINMNNAAKKNEPEVIVEELPRSYKQRKFLNDASSITSDLFMIPGNIVTYNPKDSSYQFRTLKAITRNNKPPIVTSISDGQVYSAKINSTTSFNGTYLIGGLTVSRDQIMELNINDVAISTVPDSLVDVDAIKSAISGMTDDDKKNLYYIKAATLTTIDSRKYTESKFDAAVNSCFVTAGGKTYGSNEKFKRDKNVSVFIIPLDHILNSVH